MLCSVSYLLCVWYQYLVVARYVGIVLSKYCRPRQSNPPSVCLFLLLVVSARSFLLPGALNTDWDGEGGAKNRLKEAVDSFRLEGLVVDGVRLGAV